MTAILETERLFLRPYEVNMAQAVYQVVQRREIADTMLMIPHPYPQKRVAGWLQYVQKSFELGTAFEYAVFTKEPDARYIGNCGLVAVSTAHQSGELGYFIDPEAWGQGYGTEACRRVVHHAFTELGLNRLFGRCLVRNPASRRVLEKAGLAFEGRFKQEFFMDGVYEDIDYLAILKSGYTQRFR